MKSSKLEAEQGIRSIVLACAIAAPLAGLVIFILVVTRGTSGESLLYRYQTLLAGILALIAAFIGGHFINKQVRLDREQEDERLRRRHAAARAVMPLSLSALVNYATVVASTLERERPRIVNDSQWRKWTAEFELPPLPDVIDDFSNMVEAANASDRVAFVQLLSDIQVQSARLSFLKDRLNDALTEAYRRLILDSVIMDAIYLQALASSLFEYARGLSDKAPAVPTWGAMRNAVISDKFSPNSEFFALIEEKARRPEPPTL